MRHLPKDWKVMRLEECLAEIVDYRGKAPEKTDNGIPLITARNVKDGSLDFSEPEFIREDTFDDWMQRGQPVEGDVLFTTEAPLGNVAEFPHGKFAMAQRVVALRGKAGLLNNRFLMSWLLSHDGRRAIQFRSSGSTALGIRQSELRIVEMPLPPFDEQVAIGEISRSWTTAVGCLEKIIQSRMKCKLGLMQQLLTGQTRFKEFVKSGKKVTTRYGDFPADWSQMHMGEIADEAGKKNGGGKDLPVLSCTKHRGLVNSLEYFGKQIFSEDTSTYRIVERSDFAYATNHIEEGSIGYQNLHDAGLISPMYTVFRTKPGVDHEFFWKLIKTELYRHIFEVNTSGSIARRGALRWDEFALIKVFLPSVPEQKRIAAVLNTCDREIELLEKQLEALKEQKRGLMQKLLTGEIRVKTN